MWKSLGRRDIQGKVRGWQFTGEAELFEWDDYPRPDFPDFVCRAKVDVPPSYEGQHEPASSFLSGSSGYVADACKRVFRQLRGTRMGGAKYLYTDVGPPIGEIGFEADGTLGVINLDFVYPGRMTRRRGSEKTSVSTPHRLLALEGRIASSERMAAPKYKDYVLEKRRRNEKPLSEEDWKARVLGAPKKEPEKGSKLMRMTGKLQRDIYDRYARAPWVHDLQELAKYAEDGALDKSHHNRLDNLAKKVDDDVRDRDDKDLIWSALEAMRETIR